MVNPSDMTDEELAKAIEGTPPEEPESPVEETPEVEQEEPKEAPAEEAPAEEAPEEEPKEEEKPPSRREQLRIQQLLAKYGDPTKKAPEPKQTKPTTESLDYSQALEADPEVIQKLEADRQARSDQAYLEGLRQSEVREWKRDLKYENNTVLERFKFLNPKDENFKPAAADAMNSKYLRFVGYNPGDPERGIPESVQYSDVSYLEFVESEMEFADELASHKVAESTKNIAKQAATAGLRPDGSTAKRLNLNQAPEKMTIDELYASIGNLGKPNQNTKK